MNPHYVIVNGELVKSEEAVVSLYDHGFLYGMGFFETLRTYEGGKPFLLEQHWARLKQACDTFGIALKFGTSEIRQWIAQLRQKNEWTDTELYVRITVSAGAIDSPGLPTTAQPYARPNVYMMARPLSGNAERAKAICVLNTVRNSPELLSQHRAKSLHYMNSIAAKLELNERTDVPPGTEGIQLNKEGYVTEGIVSNIFIVRDGIILTPPLEAGILPGITRAHVMQLAAVEQRWLTVSDLHEADELFVTNSVQQIVPITAIYDHSLKRTLEIGPVTEQVMNRYEHSIKEYVR